MRAVGIFFAATLCLGSARAATPTQLRQAFDATRQRLRQSCSSMPRWQTNFRIASTPIPMGQIRWECPGSFRLLYQGPGAFEYITNGNEAWVARPALNAPGSVQVEHHWRLDGSDLELLLGYLKGNDKLIGDLEARFKAQVSSGKGEWRVSLLPHSSEDFRALRVTWNLSSGHITRVDWESPQGLPLAFELDPPRAWGNPSPRDFSPVMPPNARVTKFPEIKRR